jgi:hypothetical protein
MQERILFHGATGDEILSIMSSGTMRPNGEGEIFFDEFSHERALQHGADLRRKLTFAAKMLVHIGEDVTTARRSVPGNPHALVIHATKTVPVRVLELYVRRPRGDCLEVYSGEPEIRRILES